MPSQTQPPILGDHKKIRKRLVPPLLAFMGDRYAPYSWARELVPEVIWLALLHRGLGLRRGIDFAINLALGADQICTRPIKPFFCKITSFSSLDSDQRHQLAKEIAKKPDFAEARRALAPLFELFPDSPLAFLAGGSCEAPPGENTELAALLPEMFDRRSRTAVLAMATAAVIGFKQGKIVIASEKAPQITKALTDNFREIEKYPETEESRVAASSIRAMVPMFLLGDKEDVGNQHQDWLDYFWENLANSGECALDVDQDVAENEPADELGRIVVRFRNAARRELQERLRKWKFDLNRIEQHEVVSALLARQTTLATDLASSPAIWTPHSAPLFLRAMADVFIALAWMLKDPQVRAHKFIDDGLGRVKLELEHRKQQIEKGCEDDPRAKRIVEYWQAWLSSQRLEEFVEVNLGSWSGLNTRQMAEEAGCLDFYNYVYQPFSAAVHSTWPHISTHNTLYCENPAHRYHRVAITLASPIDPYWLLLGAKYLEKAFKEFDQATGIHTNLPSAYDQLHSDLGNDPGENTPATEPADPQS